MLSWEKTILPICKLSAVTQATKKKILYDLHRYTRLKINWSGTEFVLNLTYGTVVALVGTLIGVGVLSKLMGISDAMIGIISTVFTLISKPVYVS